MTRLEPGTRLRSSVCATEVMVVAAPDADVEIACGGAPMLDVAQGPPAARSPVAAGAGEGTKLGKRYVDPSGGALMKLKEAKPLPSSD
jgi:hypothetical protein